MKKKAIEEVERYLNALINMKYLLDTNDRVNVSKLTQEYKLNSRFGVAIQNCNIVKTQGYGKGRTYEWIAGEPSRFMARRVIDESLEMARTSNLKHRERNKKGQFKKGNSGRPKGSKNKVKKGLIDYFETKIFFGLIKIKTKAIYK